MSGGFGIYLSYLLPKVPGVTRWAPLAVIAVFSAINYRGVRGGARTQNLFTFLKVAGIGVLIGGALLSGAPAAFEWRSAAAGALSMRGLMTAMLGCFLAYDGWQYIASVAGEVREPQRNLPLALALGSSIVICIYVLANIAYMKVLPLAEIAATERVAAAVAERSLGPLGANLITLTIMLSSAGAANGGILASARIYFAQARDGLFFRKLAEVHPRFGAPAFSLLAQAIWSALLASSGSYEALFSFALFAMWLFHAMTVFAVVLLRRRYPDRPRPYRMWGYPAAPCVFAAFALWFVLNTLRSRPGPSLVGSLIIASGVPVYYLWERRGRGRGSP